nr:hypothetical protein [uncultured Dongia sp.]
MITRKDLRFWLPAIAFLIAHPSILIHAFVAGVVHGWKSHR